MATRSVGPGPQPFPVPLASTGRGAARRASLAAGGPGAALLLAIALLAACTSAPHRYADQGSDEDAEARRALAQSRNPRTHHWPARPDAPGEAAKYELLRRVPPGADRVPMSAYPSARAAAAAMAAAARAADGAALEKSRALPRWQPLGPENVAGRTRTLEFDPRNPDRMLAGGVSGGVWESLDAAASWHPLSVDTSNINIGSLLIDPVAPDTIYAGTGELYRNNNQPFAAMWGQGILRSSDGGRTFQTLLATQNDDFRYVADLAISPNDHRRIYAATNSGIWRSDDAGASFSRILRLADSAGNAMYEGCNDLLMLPDTGHDVLLASCASRSTDDRYYLAGTLLPPACSGPCPAAIFRNEDAGGAGSFSSMATAPEMGRTTLAYAKSNPNVVYAVSANIGAGSYRNGLYAVWRSTDRGRSWQTRVRYDSADKLSTYLLSYADTFEGSACGFGADDPYSAGWYNQAIAVDPTNENVVWVAGMEHYRSEDGGASFGKASYWFNAGSSSDGVHADQHLLKFDPRYDGVGNRRLFSTNDGGISVTENATANTTRGARAVCAPATNGVIAWHEADVGMSTTQFYTGAVTADGIQYLGGLQDNGTVLNTSDGNNLSWRSIYGGDGASVAIDPRNRNTLYVSFQGFTQARSPDGGFSFVNAHVGLSDVGIFIVPYILDTTAPDRLYLGGSRIWRTDNQGRNWRTISTALGSDYYDRVSAMAVSVSNPNVMLVGNYRGIFRNSATLTATSGTTWAATSPRTGWVSSLTFAPGSATVAYATYSTFGGSHVWRTTDAGVTWTPIDGSGSGALPDVPVNTLAVDPNNAQRLFIGSDIGIFVSIDGGAHWALEDAGFVNTIVEQLVITGTDTSIGTQLYAFTYGRGAWRVPIADLTAAADYRIAADTTGSFYNPAQPGHGWFVEAIPSEGVTGVLVAWYTYQNGSPRWLFGNGTATGNHVTIPLYQGRATEFPPHFDGGAVRVEPWGSVDLTFDDRDHYTAHWTPNGTIAGYTEGAMDFSRLTTALPADTRSASHEISSCHTGAWYNASQPGHGLTVEVDDVNGVRQLVGAWYAYDHGRSYWIYGQGPISGNTATMDMLSLDGSGAQFPPNFDASQVSLHPWGTISFRAVDADHAHIHWAPVQAGFDSGDLDLVRLTNTLGRNCTP